MPQKHGPTMFGASPNDIYSDAGPGNSLDLDTDRPIFNDDTYRPDSKGDFNFIVSLLCWYIYSMGLNPSGHTLNVPLNVIIFPFLSRLLFNIPFRK